MAHGLARIHVAHAQVVAESVGRRRVGKHVEDEGGNVLGRNVAAGLEPERQELAKSVHGRRDSLVVDLSQLLGDAEDHGARRAGHAWMKTRFRLSTRSIYALHSSAIPPLIPRLSLSGLWSSKEKPIFCRFALPKIGPRSSHVNGFKSKKLEHGLEIAATAKNTVTGSELFMAQKVRKW